MFAMKPNLFSADSAFLFRRSAWQPAGTPLKQGAVYFDLAARESGPRVAHGPASARSDQFLIPKNEVPFELWNRLVSEIH